MNSQISLFSGVSRSICVVCITGYQKYLSPHKGFACAHRVLYQGESCSQYIKKVVAQEGIQAALQKSRARFQACREANNILRARRLQYLADSSGNLTSMVMTRSMARRMENADDFGDINNGDLDNNQKGEDINNPENHPETSNKNQSQHTRTCDRLADNACLTTDCGDWACCGEMACDAAVPDGLDCGALDCGGLDCGGCG